MKPEVGIVGARGNYPRAAAKIVSGTVLAFPREALMVTDHFIDDEAQELLRKLRIESRISGELAESSDLSILATRIGGGQTGFRFVAPDGLRHLEPLGEHVDKRRIDIVDGRTETGELWVRHGTVLSGVIEAIATRCHSGLVCVPAPCPE